MISVVHKPSYRRIAHIDHAILNRFVEPLQLCFGLGSATLHLGDMLATPSALNKEGLSSQFVAHPMVVYESPSFFMFSKRSFSPQFLQQFNQALARSKETDAYDIIWQRYGPGR